MLGYPLGASRIPDVDSPAQVRHPSRHSGAVRSFIASEPIPPCFSREPTTPVLGSARLSGERAIFVSAKVAKTIAPGMPVSATSCYRNCPAMLADHAPARTRASMRSNMRALPAGSAVLLGAMQRHVGRFVGGHPWPHRKPEWAPRMARFRRAKGMESRSGAPPASPQVVQRLGEAVRVRAFGLGQRLEPVGDFLETFVARGLGHAGIHVGVFVGF